VRWTVRSAQIVTLVGVLLLTALFVGGSAYYNARFAVEDLGHQLLEQSAERVREHVDAMLDVAVAEGATNRDLLARGALDYRDHEKMTRWFLASLQAQPTLSYLSMGLETGEYWHVFRDQHGAISVQWLLPNLEGGFDLVDYDPQPDGTLRETHRDRNTARTPPYERPYYKAARAAGTSMWPETYIFLSAGGAFDVPGLTRATPVYDDKGTFVGVLTADFDLYALSRDLERVAIGERGLSFLLELRDDGTRRVIAHPDMPERLDLTAPVPGGSGREALPAERVADARVTALVAHVPAMDASLPSQLAPVRIDVAGTTWVGGYRPLGGEDRPRWLIAMLIPEDELLGRVQAMNRITLWIALGGLLLVLLLAVVLSNRVSAKLRHVASETERIGGFHLEPKPAVRSRVEEIDQLGVAVEEMKSGLRSFQKYVSADLVRSILASGQEARLGGARRKITVYFSDIAGFTSIAERLEPEVLVELLADYLDAMTKEMLASGATVDKYIGDAIMAFWGAPHASEDQAWLACRTALAHQETLARLRERWMAQGHPDVHARIGLHTGEALVGNFGSEGRLDYTALGDTVNLASRLEGLNKRYGTWILLTESTLAEVADRVVARRIDRVAVKGRAGGTLIHELVGLRGQVDPALLERNAQYEAALDLYFAMRFEEAGQAFANLESSDPPSRVMRERCATYVADPPPGDWDGVHVMQQK